MGVLVITLVLTCTFTGNILSVIVVSNITDDEIL